MVNVSGAYWCPRVARVAIAAAPMPTKVSHNLRLDSQTLLYGPMICSLPAMRAIMKSRQPLSRPRPERARRGVHARVGLSLRELRRDASLRLVCQLCEASQFPRLARAAGAPALQHEARPLRGPRPDLIEVRRALTTPAAQAREPPQEGRGAAKGAELPRARGLSDGPFPDARDLAAVVAVDVRLQIHALLLARDRLRELARCRPGGQVFEPALLDQPAQELQVLPVDVD